MENSVFEDDALEASENVDENRLGIVSELAAKQLMILERIDELKEELELQNVMLMQVQDKDLPDAMAAVNLSEVKLTTGKKITIKPMYFGSATPEGMDWLRKHGHGDLIKNEVRGNFGRGEEEQAELMRQLLIEQGVPFSSKNSVHPQTMKAFIREQVEKGADIPLEKFKAHIINRCIIK